MARNLNNSVIILPKRRYIVILEMKAIQNIHNNKWILLRWMFLVKHKDFNFVDLQAELSLPFILQCDCFSQNRIIHCTPNES